VPGIHLVLGQSPAREIAGSHIQDIALVNETIKCGPEFFQADPLVDVMHLIQIDVVCLQSLE
jgi:hypothetical protein